MIYTACIVSTFSFCCTHAHITTYKESILNLSHYHIYVNTICLHLLIQYSNTPSAVPRNLQMLEQPYPNIFLCSPTRIFICTYMPAYIKQSYPPHYNATHITIFKLTKISFPYLQNTQIFRLPRRIKPCLVISGLPVFINGKYTK